MATPGALLDVAPTVDRDPIARLVQRRQWTNFAAGSVMFAAAASSIVVTCSIVGILLFESITFFTQTVSPIDFLTDTMWTPQFANPRYGILPLVTGTLVTTFVALSIALPVGTIVAMYLSEFAPHAVRETIKPLLEMLSAVPTIIYGYFALQFMTPLLQKFVPGLPTFNMLSAGIVMGVMIIPYVSSLSEDAMRSVPMLLREGAYAMGANKVHTGFHVVFPAAFSGIASAYVLGVSRAIGETMIVAVSAGMQANLTFDPRQPAETITAYIVQVSQGDLEHGSPGYQSIFAAGITLFAMTLTFNILGHQLRKRFRQTY